jgi:hypothetical protein
MPQTTIKSDGFQYGWTITYVLVVLLVFLPRVSLKVVHIDRPVIIAVSAVRGLLRS